MVCVKRLPQSLRKPSIVKQVASWPLKGHTLGLDKRSRPYNLPIRLRIVRCCNTSITQQPVERFYRIRQYMIYHYPDEVTDTSRTKKNAPHLSYYQESSFFYSVSFVQYGPRYKRPDSY